MQFPETLNEFLETLNAGARSKPAAKLLVYIQCATFIYASPVARALACRSGSIVAAKIDVFRAQVRALNATNHAY